MNFHLLVLELVKVICIESKRSIAITSVYWVLLTVTLAWGCLWWGVPSQMED